MSRESLPLRKIGERKHFPVGWGPQREVFSFSQVHQEIIFHQVGNRQPPLSGTFWLLHQYENNILLIAEDGVLQREALSLGILLSIDHLINQQDRRKGTSLTDG